MARAFVPLSYQFQRRHCGASPFEVEKYDTRLHRQQSGAVVACWAHNPEVRGSKPRSAKRLYFLLYTFKKMITTKTSTLEKNKVKNKKKKH